MSSSLPLIAPGPESLGSDGQSSSSPSPNPRRRPAPAAEPEPAPQAAPDPGQRLVIQEDGDTGDLIYTVIDRASGQVVAKTSREDLARMSQRADYAAGSFIKAKA